MSYSLESSHTQKKFMLDSADSSLEVRLKALFEQSESYANFADRVNDQKRNFKSAIKVMAMHHPNQTSIVSYLTLFIALFSGVFALLGVTVPLGCRVGLGITLLIALGLQLYSTKIQTQNIVNDIAYIYYSHFLIANIITTMKEEGQFESIYPSARRKLCLKALNAVNKNN